MLVGLATLLVVLLVFCLAFNRFTDTRSAPPKGLRFIQAGDVATRVQVWGAVGGTGRPVLLVHGAAESADTWDRVAEQLAPNHPVYAIDLDGWGYSQRVAPFDMDHQTRQLLAAVHALRLQRPVLVGHSSGAAIIAEAALREPRSVGGVMLLDGDALATGAGQRTPLSHLVLPPLRTTVLRLAVGSDSLIRNIYRAQCGPHCPDLDAAGIDSWRRPFQVPGAEAGLWGMLAAGVPGLSTDRLSKLAQTPIPKAVVFGAQDDVFPPGTPGAIATLIGAGTPTIIPDARHLSLISDPGPIAAAIRTLADRIPSA